LPRVPTYDQRQVQSTPIPGVRQNIQTSDAEFGGAQAQALEQTGQAGTQFGSTVADFEAKRQEDMNRTAVWNAYTNLSDQERNYLYNGTNGVLTKTGADALGASSRAAKDIGDIAKTQSDTLQNDEQKQQFQELYSRKLDNTLDSVSRYEADQRQTYHDQIATGVVKSAQQDAAVRWNDPTYIDQTADLAVIALSGNLQNKGTATELIDSETKAMRSGIWKSALSQAIQQSPLQAKQLLDDNRDKMTGDDASDIDKLLKTPLLAAQAQKIAGMVTTPAGSLPQDISQKIVQSAQASGVDVGTALTIAKLENSKGDPNLKNPNSSATGIYQFIDGSWKAAGGTDANRGDVDKQIELGVKSIKDNRDALRVTLGQDPSPSQLYLAHQQGIAGARALITAAPGDSAVSVLTKVYKGDAVTAAQAVTNNGGNLDISAQDFVNKWDVQYAKKSGSAGVAAMPLADQIDAAKALAGDDPDLQEHAVAEVIRQRSVAKQAQSDDQDAAMERIYGHVLQTGSYQGADVSDIAKLDNKTLLALQEKSRDVKTNWGFYDQFMSMSAADKAKVPLVNLMTNLSDTDLKSAIKERNDAKDGASKQPWVESRANIINSYATEAGMKVQQGNKPLSTDDQAKYNSLSEYMNGKMDAYRVKNGVEMPESDFRQEAGRALTRVVTKQGTFFNDTSRVFELSGKPVVTINSVSDVPANIRGDIESTLRSRGKKVNESLILSLAKAWVTGDSNGAKTILDGAN
jgi:hypothetical protein